MSSRDRGRAVLKVQDVGGKVIDENGAPMPFTNVVLLSLPDSTFIQGAATNEQGNFNIATDINKGVLKVSCVGYETLYITAANGLTIQMKEDATMLGEVVVKSALPKTFVKGDAMRTTVAGTILEKAGTVSDMLDKIPSLEASDGGGVKVLGRGDAEVYINGRQVRDMNELSRLRSDQIQHVEVVQNPGARYAASTKAVVRITLKKAQGEGFSFQDNLMGMYQYNYTLHNNLDLNYRTGGLDITASLWAGRFGHSKMLQDNHLSYYVGPDHIEGITTQDGRNIWKGWSPQLQINYMVNENHSFGAFYKYDHHPSTDFYDCFTTDNYENGIYKEHSVSDITQSDRFRKHIFNAYYNGKIGNLSIDLNIDGLFDKTTTPGKTVEQTFSIEHSPLNIEHYNNAQPMVNAQSSMFNQIESNTDSGNKFWATKLIFGYPVLNGNLSVGGEYSHNHRTDAYTYNATAAVSVQTTDTEINESSTAAFVEYGRSFGKVYTQVGLRYEHLKYSLTPDPSPSGEGSEYSQDRNPTEEVTTPLSNRRGAGGEASWFPSAVISAPIGKVQLSLSYRRDIQRPNYSSLTSSTIYINRYTYQSGNPYLKPTYTHSIVVNAAYKWMNLMLNYGRIKDSETLSTEPFPGSTDPLISLVRPINSEEDFDQLSVSFSANPVIGCWHPGWSAFAVFQNYKTLCAEGSMKTLSHPYLNLVWKNDFELPKNFRLSANMVWSSCGDYNNFRITTPRFNTSLGVQHDVNLHRMGTMTFDLRCIDIFNTSKSEATIFGIREITTANPARRTFMLNITWKFNEAHSKYRGSGAGEKQKARM